MTPVPDHEMVTSNITDTSDEYKEFGNSITPKILTTDIMSK